MRPGCGRRIEMKAGGKQVRGDGFYHDPQRSRLPAEGGETGSKKINIAYPVSERRQRSNP